MTMRAGEVYEHPYERLVVRVGTAESDGRELVADLYVRADAPGVPHHIHPTVAETLTVVRGRVSAWSPDEGEGILDLVRRCASRQHCARLAAGGRRGGPHAGRGRPGARFEEMWRQFMGLLQDGKAGPKGPGFLQIMMMAHGISPTSCRCRSAAVPAARRRGARYADRTASRLQGSV